MSDAPEPDDKNVVYVLFSPNQEKPVEFVLRDAMKADLKTVVVVGYDQNGEEYFASSIGDGAEVCWLLQEADHRVRQVARELSSKPR